MNHNNELPKFTKIPIYSDPNLGKIDKIDTDFHHSLVLFENGILYCIKQKFVYINYLS